MTKEELFAKLADLPTDVQDVLFSERSGELNLKLIENHRLPEESQAALFDLVNEIMVHAVPLDGLAPEIEKRLKLDKAAANALARDVAGFRLLPLDKWLGDVSGYIRILSGNPSTYPADRVQVVTHTPDQAADDLIRNVGVSDLEPHLRDRLKDAVKPFFHGIRSEAQLLEILMRPEKIGGMNMTEGEAKRISEEAKEMQRATIIGEPSGTLGSDPSLAPNDKTSINTASEPQKGSDPSLAPNDKTSINTASEPQKGSDPPVAPKGQSPRIDAPTDEDEKEVARIGEKIAGSVEVGRSAETAERIAASILEIVSSAGIKLADPKLEERLKSVVGARLRDVCDSLETLEVLVQPKELGGLSLSEDEARRLLKIIDGKLRAVHEEHRDAAVAGKTAWLQEEARKKQESDSMTQVKESVQMENLYQGIVGKSPKATRMAAKVAAQPPVLPKMAPSGTPAEHPPSFTSAETIVAVAPAPTPPPPIRPPLTIVRPLAQMAAGPSTRPLMQDVKPIAGDPSRLTGPVEELRTTAIEDFRRLSKDPTIACAKILEKLELLHRQSYEKRTAGIQAWMESEVFRTYLETMRDALEGNPMPTVIAERERSGRSTLTIEEVQAIAELSRKLRY